MSAIPTDAMVDFWIEIIIYIQIYWWLRSPGTNSAVSAYLVNSDGYEIFSRVDYISCGRIIAGRVHVLQLYVFLCNGRRKYDYICSRISLRRRSPDISDAQFVWMIFPSGFINHNLDYTISYSYGRISPVTTISEFTQIVYPNGILNNGSYGVDNSYGTLRTSIMYIHGSLV